MPGQNTKLGLIIPVLIGSTVIILLVIVIIGTVSMMALPPPPKSVVLDPGEILGTPSTFLNNSVIVQGEAAQMITHRAFVLNGENAQAKLVVIEDDVTLQWAPRVNPGNVVQASGTIGLLSERELGYLECQLKDSLPAEDFGIFEGQPYLLAAGLKLVSH